MTVPFHLQLVATEARLRALRLRIERALWLGNASAIRSLRREEFEALERLTELRKVKKYGTES